MIPVVKKQKRSAGRWIRRGALLIFLAYLLAALLPYMLPPTAGSLAADWREAQSSDENVNLADLLETGEEAMTARLKLIQDAQRSISVASYIYANDESGRTISAALIAAADRGVKVRILIDGLIGAVNLHNAPIAYALGSHPNIEVRFYNPVDVLSPAGLNARFHEKYVIVDEQWLILGGRNISDEFLTPSDNSAYNFDLDVLLWKKNATAYDAVSQVSQYYDGLWDSAGTRFSTVSQQTAKAVAQELETLRQQSEGLNDAYGLSGLNLSAGLVPVTKTIFMVNPTQADVKTPLLWKQLCSLMSDAQERLWIMTPYLVMNSVMRDDLAAIQALPDSKLLLNSRNGGNNIMASADYVFHKGMALKLPLPIYEFQGDASMHTKSILIDDSLSVFGSFNFDIRSAYIDTETMLAVDSPELNQRLEAYMTDMYGDALRSRPDGYDENRQVAPKEGSFMKTLGIYLLSPFVSLFRFLV